jgi:hypothetical protein
MKTCFFKIATLVCLIRGGDGERGATACSLAPYDSTSAPDAGVAYLFSIEPFTPALPVTHSGGTVIVS